MKKITLILSFLFLVFYQYSYSQAWEGKGDKTAQVGLSGWGYGTGLQGRFDYGISKIISVGAGINLYLSDTGSAIFPYGIANFHLQKVIGLPQKMDLYPGIDLGFYGGQVGYDVHVGFSYYFNNKFGAYILAGSNGSLGVCMKL